MITLFIFVCAGLGFWIGYYSTLTDISLEWLALRAAMIMISTVVFGFIHIIIHEIGHMIAGKIAGYHFLLFRIFNLAVIKEKNQYRFANYSIMGTGGQCLMVPPERVDEPPYRLYLMGGALANGITALLALGLVLFLPDALYLYLFAFVGIVSGVLNLIPFGFTDGQTLKQLKHDPNKQHQLIQELRLTSDFVKGRMFSEIKENELIENPNEPMTEQFNAYTVLLQINKELESENFGHALELIEPLWKQRLDMIKPYQVEIAKEYLFCHLTMETEDTLIQDEIIGDPLFKQYLKANQLESYRLKAAMAFWIDDDLDQADQWIEKAEQSLDHAPTYADKVLNKRLVDVVSQKVREERTNRAEMAGIEEEIV